MASTLKINNLDSATGTTITIPTGKTLVGTDTATVRSPGTVLQVVNGPGNVARIQSSATSYTDTPITATITPKATSSKILVNWSTGCLSPDNNYLYFRLMCAIGGGSQALVNTNEDHTILDGYDEANWEQIGHGALHSPNTTSACVYTLQAKSAAGPWYVGWSNDADNKNMMDITLMEIAQ